MRYGIVPLLLLLLIAPASVYAQEDSDPWERWNRRVFAFNEFVDRYAIKPVAKGYKAVTPRWVDDSVTRFFQNLADLHSALNNGLQGEFSRAGNNGGRFLFNSTLGVAGLFDVATSAGLRKYPDDLDLTLDKWGVSEGPFVMLPFIGPSTLRGALVMWPEDYLRPRHYVTPDSARYALLGAYVIDLRGDLLDVEQAISGDRYIFLRDFYLQSRRMAAGKAPLEDDFGDDLPDGGWDDEAW